MSELTVSSGLARGLFELAVSGGANPVELTKRSGVSPEDLADLDGRIPFATYVALMRAGQTLADDPALALHYGESSDLSEISVVGLITHACRTMQEASVQLNRYGRLVVEIDGPAERFGVTRRDGGLWAVDNRENPNEFPELTESTFARLICGPRRVGVAQIAQAVHVTHTAPEYRAEYERIFAAPVTFDAGWNAILLNERWLNHEIAAQPRYVFGILSDHAEALLARLAKSKSTRGRVENLLAPVLHTGELSIDVIAAKMGLSRQTLFRRLKSEGVTFEKVLDELRHQMALRYLSAKKVSVHEAAYLVGFSEAAAFSRAFKRWTGLTPRSVQRR
jgi:AraC-like DNA-binding protein